ncbi:PREDICTED: uncharacterized protein LOC105971282 [Erythranthe guttata]|uniref:uncharacterized protein LOC105971282 n=1 Tax=Erythranthe guttata TaxID=4155 RepID=UPI00064DC26A|nr:PREDICTED: uncharacterized protein LOC105971282 [Erythranthe guttata]|eukprot:XP_012851583.1 PREDICTED: uncharacterized protein LOC105971282 [Erythranthe guttata]
MIASLFCSLLLMLSRILPDSEDLQNGLAILYRKRQQLLKNENHDNRKSTKQTKSPDIFSRVDLHVRTWSICVKNYWRLPKYFVAPPNGYLNDGAAMRNRQWRKCVASKLTG